MFLKERRTVVELAKRTGIPSSTLYFWRRNPGKMPLGKFAQIARELNLKDEEIISLVRKGV